jgi:hypothetical protein
MHRLAGSVNPSANNIIKYDQLHFLPFFPPVTGKRGIILAKA